MNDKRPATTVCRCGKKNEPFYNPMTQRWIPPTPRCFDRLQALGKNEEKAGKTLSMIVNGGYESVHTRLIITNNPQHQRDRTTLLPCISSHIVGMSKALKMTRGDDRF